jgi:hypothetical protein
MNARYLDPNIQFDPHSRMGQVEFRIRNVSAQTWRPAEGFCVGYQVFDDEMGGLVADGARVVPERDPGPGESARLGITFHLPAEDGRYQVFVSPLSENLCWYYERNCPFLLIEGAMVEGRLATRLRWRISTKSRLRRARVARAGARALVYPVATIWRNRGLIRAMVRHDIVGRYRGSFGGIFWTVINPLLPMLTYFLCSAWCSRHVLASTAAAPRSPSISLPACCRGLRSARPPAAPLKCWWSIVIS